jgi:hypothetical protein
MTDPNCELGKYVSLNVANKKYAVPKIASPPHSARRGPLPRITPATPVKMIVNDTMK